MSSQRVDAILSNVTREGRSINYPRKPDGWAKYTSEIFGENVFTLKAMEQSLPKPVYKQFVKQRNGRTNIDPVTADAIAHAVRVWAMDRGATHFTHWFQPQTDSTAEKHDAFLSFKYGEGDPIPIDSFSGSQLLQSEPDASSFPSGGMRTTFEARGYTIWDTTSPMFLQKGPANTSILYIPSVFITYNGEALDEKTFLLRSCEAISRQATELCNLCDPVPAGQPPAVSRVQTTLGTEQEYFLVDRALYSQRPDLKTCGRTLLGKLPAKHQQMEDHYFGRIPTRVLATMSELEFELYRLGVPVKTRHNEVAPAQFELAPVFEESSLAVDHNLITMDMLHRVAHRHKMKALLHEKPYAGVNGSGKHCNWSMSTDAGENLLDPSVRPETNHRFLLFLLSVLLAVQRHGGLLRAGIASSSNDHRLGANEAPPGIISAFLGEHLSEVLDSIEQGRAVKNFSQPHMQTIKVGGTVLDLKVASLPSIARDLTDRNRTSPFAFTGNKFEFRAVGSKQSVSFPMTLLNCAVAQTISEVIAEVRTTMGDKPAPSKSDLFAVIKKYIAETKAVRFEGDNYSEEWAVEAEKRGLLNIRSCDQAFEQLITPGSQHLLTKQIRVFSEGELHSRYHILNEKYTKDIVIEALTLIDLLTQQVIPAAIEFRQKVASTGRDIKELGASNKTETDVLNKLSVALEKVTALTNTLKENTVAVQSVEEPNVSARDARNKLLPLMETIREECIVLEENIGAKYWPLPSLSELMTVL